MSTKPNYRSWAVDIADFSNQITEANKLKFLLNFAILAPSGHNTQPWNFSIRDNTISLFVNRARSLEGSDPHRRQLMIAFGCMIENLVVAADYYRYAADIHYFPDPGNTDHIANISFVEKADSAMKHHGNLITAIELRHTNRGKYLDRPFPKHFLENIEQHNTSDLKISIITEQKKKHIIADIVNEAQIETMDDPAFREELSQYIRSSFTKESTGMPGFALEIPAPISLFVARIIKRVNVSRKNKEKDDALLKQHTPGAFIVVSSRENNLIAWLNAGRLFERIWLTATADGLNCSPLAAVIQSKSHNDRLRQALEIDFEPQVFFRIGYGEKQFRHSPRFSVAELLI